MYLMCKTFTLPFRAAGSAVYDHTINGVTYKRVSGNPDYTSGPGGGCPSGYRYIWIDNSPKFDVAKTICGKGIVRYLICKILAWIYYHYQMWNTSRFRPWYEMYFPVVKINFLDFLVVSPAVKKSKETLVTKMPYKYHPPEAQKDEKNETRLPPPDQHHHEVHESYGKMRNCPPTIITVTRALSYFFQQTPAWSFSQPSIHNPSSFVRGQYVHNTH